MARPIPFAVIRNPRSGGNRGADGRAHVIARALGMTLAEPDTPAALDTALRRFRADGVGLLGIDGGDGTVREVASALSRMAWTPRLAVVPSGRINLIARDVGLRRGGEAGLRQVAVLARERGEAIRVERRRLLRLDRAGKPPLFGMFAGAAAFTDACRVTNTHIHPRGLGGQAAIAAGIAAALARAAAGRGTDGLPMRVAVDAAAPIDGRRFLLLATTLDRLPLGLWPFWAEGAGAVHLLDVAAPPRALPRALLPLMVGWKRPWMSGAGYRSRDADAVELELSEPLVLDGEEFPPGADGRIRLSAGPEMEFVRP
mgnify:CR=1 FL=1